jgi:hypothetical protein
MVKMDLKEFVEIVELMVNLVIMVRKGLLEIMAYLELMVIEVKKE